MRTNRQWLVHHDRTYPTWTTRPYHHDSFHRTTHAAQHRFLRFEAPPLTVPMYLQIYPLEVGDHTDQLVVRVQTKAPRFATLHQHLLLLRNIFSPRHPISPQTWHEDIPLPTFASTDGNRSSSLLLSMELLPIPGRTRHRLRGHRLLIAMARKINNASASPFLHILYRVPHACIHNRAQRRRHHRLLLTAMVMATEIRLPTGLGILRAAATAVVWGLETHLLLQRGGEAWRIS